MNNLYDGISKIVERSKEQEVQYGTIQSVGINDIAVSVAGAKTPHRMKKPADFNGGRGDSCSIVRNPRTKLWEIVEVRRNAQVTSANPSYNTPGYVVVQDWTPIPTGSSNFDIPFTAVPSQFENAIIELSDPKTNNINRPMYFEGIDSGGVARATLALNLAAMAAADNWSGFVRVNSFLFRMPQVVLNDVLFVKRDSADPLIRAGVYFNGNLNTYAGWRFRIFTDLWGGGTYRILGF